LACSNDKKNKYNNPHIKSANAGYQHYLKILETAEAVLIIGKYEGEYVIQ
jgi:hypothetical protein